MDRSINITNNKEHRTLWHLSVTCFVLAGLTGFLYRLGMLGWVPGDLSLGNIRHAHSHLMFFGWAVPLPLYIVMQEIRNKSIVNSGAVRWMRNSIAAVLLFGLLAYPFFLLYGYQPVIIGSAALPLSVIFSGFVMLSWYGFIIGFWKSRHLLKNDKSLPWFDGALILLVVCSLGAWGVAVVQEIAPQSHLLMKSMTHFFLSAFTEGWVVLVLCGILISKLKIKDQNWWVSPQFALAAIAIGAPLTFPYGISESLLSPMLLGTARLGGGLAAIGLLSVIAAVFKSGKWQHPILIWPVILLALKGTMQLAASVIPSSFWLSDPALRILYLHILLLGALTLTGIGWLHIQAKIAQHFYLSVVASVVLLLLGLILPSIFWPDEWSGNWIYYVLAITAFLPIATVLLHSIILTRSISLHDARH